MASRGRTVKDKLKGWLRKAKDKIREEVDRLIEIGVPELVAYVLGLLIPLPPPAKNLSLIHI